jgi:hypothetical protein
VLTRIGSTIIAPLLPAHPRGRMSWSTSH